MNKTPIYTIEDLKKLLEEALQPEYLHIEDQSCHHIGHQGYVEGVLTHIKIEMKATRLQSLTRLEQQRYVYKVLQAPLKAHIHAIELKL